MAVAWEDLGSVGGVHSWRAAVPGEGRRRWVYVRQIEGSEIHAETRSGYVRRCASVAEAQIYLEKGLGNG